MALSSRRRGQSLWTLGAIASLVLFAQTWTRAHRAGGIDLTTYLEAARAIQRGESPYALSLAFPYIYPPFLAFALIPLLYLPFDLVLAIWFAASLATMLWALRAIVLRSGVVQAFSHPADSLTPFFAALIAATYPIWQSNLRNGQVNFFVVALAILALVATRPARRGMAWGLSIAIKILPAALAPFFVRRLEWRVSAAAWATLAIVGLLPVLTLGAYVLPLTMQYGSSFLGGSFRAASASATLDFSLGGILTRASGVDSQAVRQLGTVLPVLAVFAIDLLSRRVPGTDAHMFAMYLAAIPLASPKSEVHHIAFALPAVALACGAVWFGIDRRRSFLAPLGVSAAAYVGALTLTAWSGVFWCSALIALLVAMSARRQAL